MGEITHREHHLNMKHYRGESHERRSRRARKMARAAAELLGDRFVTSEVMLWPDIAQPRRMTTSRVLFITEHRRPEGKHAVVRALMDHPMVLESPTVTDARRASIQRVLRRKMDEFARAEGRVVRESSVRFEWAPAPKSGDMEIYMHALLDVPEVGAASETYRYTGPVRR